MGKITAELEVEHEGRLDQYLASRLELSRSRVQKLIKSGRVLVNGRPARPSHRLRVGDRITVDVEEEAGGPEPADVHFSVIHEDPQIMVVDKPSGLTVHPAPGIREATLVNGLLKLRPEISGVGSIERPGIVHRLDKDTSGVMVVAKTPEAYLALQRQFQERLVKKSYIAIVEGEPPPRGEIPFSIGRDPHRPGRFSVGAHSTREAYTEFLKIVQRGGYAVLLVCPRTGRTHQIRVHLSFAGYPIAGDPLYGNPPGPIGRLALHAYCLSFIHPETGKRVRFCSPVPREFASFVEDVKFPRFCSGESSTEN